jgi:hypothetical protein
MIIDDRHKFAFVHIPKCAGTSVRSFLEQLDTTNGKFRPHVETHPTLGRIDMTHLPLAVLRQYFPNEYHKVSTYHSIAVLRDPYRRVSSSLYQRLSMYGAIPVKQLTHNEMHKALDDSISYLSRHRHAECLPYDYIHFQKQHTYVYDQGECLINRLYTTSSIDKLLEDIGILVGQDLAHKAESGAVHTNKAVFYKSTILRNFAAVLLPLYSKPVQHMFTNAFKVVVRKAIYESKDKRMFDLFDAVYVRSFVEEYYAEDLRMYEAATSNPT